MTASPTLPTSAPQTERTLTVLRAAYRDARCTPSTVVEEVLTAIAEGDAAIWIDRLPGEHLRVRAAELEAVPNGPHTLPLYGIPFAVKDNLDVAGRETTAGCPEYAHRPAHSATAVALLEAAGAILVGKTNLDQFATGLVGTRTPYGVPRNAVAPGHIPGGSSSGSGVAVASGQVAFALGTDTAGSGRIPAAMNGIVGLKPTRGIISTSGVLPACRSLDCVSVFAPDALEAAEVLDVLDRFDPTDPYARRPGQREQRPADALGALRVGVPDIGTELAPELAAAFAAHLDELDHLGVTTVPVPFAPFEAVAELLYGGPWLAERLSAVAGFLEEAPDAFEEVTRTTLQGGAELSAVEAFRAQHELAARATEVAAIFADVDVLALPSVPELVTLDDVAHDPVGPNTRLGRFTNFVNLLDLAAIAVPGGTVEGVPVGFTLIGPARSDRTLLALAGAYQGHPPADEAASLTPLAVVGAHLRGQPLHHQLTDLGARLLERTTTSAAYRLYVLPGAPPAKPGLVATGEHEPAERPGAAIEVEVYGLPPGMLGALEAQVRQPLHIGPVELADGRVVEGFRCASDAVGTDNDITHLGGWRAYLASRHDPS